MADPWTNPPRSAVTRLSRSIHSTAYNLALNPAIIGACGERYGTGYAVAFMKNKNSPIDKKC